MLYIGRQVLTCNLEEWTVMQKKKSHLLISSQQKVLHNTKYVREERLATSSNLEDFVGGQLD